MNNSAELDAALDLLERKIAKLNIKMAKSPDENIKNQLDKCLELKKEIYNGNTSIIDVIINKAKED